jgi:hypothetical protein
MKKRRNRPRLRRFLGSDKIPTDERPPIKRRRHPRQPKKKPKDK